MCFSYRSLISNIYKIRNIIIGNSGKIIASLFGLVLFNFIVIPIYQGPDFMLSVDDPVQSFSMGGERIINISIDNANFLNYHGNIGLIALERGRAKMPEGTKAIFQNNMGPIVYMDGNKQIKELLINVTNDVKEGGHLIDIIAFSNETEKKCSFYLNFIKIPD